MATPGSFSLFAFEKDFQSEPWLVWLAQNWTLSLWVGGAYLLLVALGQKWMKEREAFNLRYPLAVWSAIFGLFSIIGAISTWSDFLKDYNNKGIRYAVCNPEFHTGPARLWVIAFVISKIVELGDTAFIILRKQKLIFLHWFHHVVTLIMTWWAISMQVPITRWGYISNYSVHALMYSYYAARAMRLRIPKFVSILITSAQLVQMFTALAGMLWAYSTTPTYQHCLNPPIFLNFGLIMYALYAAMFAQFFYNAYIKGNFRNEKTTKRE